MDNGSGVDPEISEKLFQPNFTTKSSGMGLGLAISKSIVESAGGGIWYESGKNGSTFFVRLPLFKS
jgi:signal transduction histidine kinase